MSDIEIAQAADKRPILGLAEQLYGIAPEHLEPYGHCLLYTSPSPRD